MWMRLVKVYHCRSAVGVLSALVTTVVLAASGARAVQAHFWLDSQASHQDRGTIDISSVKTASIQSQDLVGGKVSSGEAAFAQLNRIVSLRQARVRDRCCDRMTLGGNRSMSPESGGIAGGMIVDRTYPLSVTASLTTYLPFVAKNYAHPLCNGGFERVIGDFAACWERDGALSVSITDTLSNGEQCYSGSRCALLGSSDYPCKGSEGGVPLGYGRVCQTFGVPYTGTVKLSFDYRVFSFDECLGGRFDCFEVYIDDVVPDETSPIRILVDGSKDGEYGCNPGDLDVTDWKEFAEFDLGAVPDGDGGTVDYRGRVVELCFYVYSREADPRRTVGWYNTWVYLDDVQIGQD